MTRREEAVEHTELLLDALNLACGQLDWLQRQPDITLPLARSGAGLIGWNQLRWMRDALQAALEDT